jgi:hypothetical protein
MVRKRTISSIAGGPNGAVHRFNLPVRGSKRRMVVPASLNRLNERDSSKVTGNRIPFARL